MWFSIVRISVSTAARMAPADIFLLSLSTIFEVSIVQYIVSVKLVGVVFVKERVRMLLG
jgi:hypothetical protein